MTTRYPVLADNTRDSIVLGWATTERGAQRVAKRWYADHSGEPVVPFEITLEGGVCLMFDPDLHATAAEIDRVNTIGTAFIAYQHIEGIGLVPITHP